MLSWRYVFISDQGRVFGTTDDPTREDFAYATVGMVTIVRLADGHYYGTEGKWRPISRGQLGTADVEGEETLPFHEPAADGEPDPNSLSSRAGDSKPADARATRFTSQPSISRGATRPRSLNLR